MQENRIWILLFVFIESLHSETSFKAYHDRDRIEYFTIRIVNIEAKQILFIRIQNEDGKPCMEKNNLMSLDIPGLPCRHCKDGPLFVMINFKNLENQNVSNNFTFSDTEARREEICNLKPEEHWIGGNVTLVSSLSLNDSCRWVFWNKGGTIGCCYSNCDDYMDDGGCDPRMQSSSCRKGLQSPIVISQNNTCILHISNFGPRDEGNYLSNFDNESPNFKAILETNGNNSSETFIVILLLCGLIFFCNCSFFKTLNKNDDSDRTRTCNPLIRSQMLYPLSYRVKFNKYY